MMDYGCRFPNHELAANIPVSSVPLGSYYWRIASTLPPADTQA